MEDRLDFIKTKKTSMGSTTSSTKTVWDFIYKSFHVPFALFFGSFTLGFLLHFLKNAESLPFKERVKKSFVFALKAGSMSLLALPLVFAKRLAYYLSGDPGEGSEEDQETYEKQEKR